MTFDRSSGALSVVTTADHRANIGIQKRKRQCHYSRPDNNLGGLALSTTRVLGCGAARALRDPSRIISVLVRNQAGEVLKAAVQGGDLAATEHNHAAEWDMSLLARIGGAAFRLDLCRGNILSSTPFEQARTLPQPCNPCEFREPCHGGCAGR